MCVCVCVRRGRFRGVHRVPLENLLAYLRVKSCFILLYSVCYHRILYYSICALPLPRFCIRPWCECVCPCVCACFVCMHICMYYSVFRQWFTCMYKFFLQKSGTSSSILSRGKSFQAGYKTYKMDQCTKN